VSRLWIQASDGAVRHRDLVKPSLDSLIAMGVAAVPELLPYLATEDARERHALTDIFQGIGKPAVSELVRVLGTGGLYHTLNSLTALAKIGDSTAAVEVLPFLGDSAYAIRAQAAETLGKTGGGNVNEALLTTLRDSVESVRKSAAVALGRRRDPRAALALAAALDDTWFGVRYAAAEALVQLDSAQVTGGRLSPYSGRPLALILDAAAERRLPLPPGRLLAFLNDGEFAVARAAARLLMHAAIGTRDRARVEALLARTADPLLAFHLRSVLARPVP
jgi:HEAT repeat protein